MASRSSANRNSLISSTSARLSSVTTRPARIAVDQSFLQQHGESVADRGPADAQLDGKLCFGNPLARLQSAAKDGRPQGLGDAIGQRQPGGSL